MSETLFNSLKAANRLPSPPAVAMRILQLVADEETTLAQLTDVISTDPALTARILKYLHSPLVGLGFEGTTLLEAVARIGTRGTQLLALSFSLLSQRHRQSCPSFNLDRFWSESLARAVAARHLGRATGQWAGDEAFVAGLVYRLGQLVLATTLPAEYEPVLRPPPEDARSLEQRERAAFGSDAIALSRQLLRHWKLPDGIWTAFAGEGEVPSATGTLLRLGDEVAAFLSRDEQQHGRNLDALVAAVAATTGLTREAARELLAEISREWHTAAQALAVPARALPDLDALEAEAEEYRTALRLAAELEVHNLRAENQQLSYLAQRDRLTGLLNRGAFDQGLGAALARAAAHGGAVALLMIDLDRFKAINDRHGHPAGDAVLRQLARLLDAHAPPPAEAFRYGGEEFAVLLPGLDETAARECAEKLRAAIAAKPASEGGRALAFTASLGVAGARWPDAPRTPDALVAEADARLYAAKQAGRNTVR